MMTATKPPLVPVPAFVEDHNESDESNESPEAITMKKKSGLPPRSGSSSSSRRKKKSSADKDLSSPETLDYLQRPITGSTEEDLSFTDFSNLDDFFKETAELFHVPPVGSGTSKFSNMYPKEDGKKIGDRSCVPSPHLFRRKKVSSADVASVGNASDTMVSVSSEAQLTGRELHENAKMYFNEGKYERALPLFEAILSAQVRRFSPLHPSVGAAMHNVGVCRQRLGQHELAENLFAEAVQIREQTLGKDHLEVAASLSKMGATCIALHKFDAAHDNLVKALNIARQNLGTEHKTVAQIMAHLGCFYFEVGELYASQATFEEALAIYRAVWSTERDRNSCMAQLTDTLCNIGSILNRRRRHAEAIESFSEALDLQRGIMGHDDSRVIATLDNLGYSYSKQKEYASALSCYRKMLRAQISRSKTFTEECFETFRKQLLMYEKLKRIPDAITETKEMMQLQKSMLPSDHVLITKMKEVLANLKKKNERLRKPDV